MRAFLLILLLLSSGCAARPGGRQWTGIDWQAVDINGIPVAPGSRVTLRIAPDQRVSGSAGCNSYGGSYRLMSKEGIRISGISSTKMACSAQLMEQENRFLSILRAVEGYNFYSDGGFSLVAPDGRAIRFRR